MSRLPLIALVTITLAGFALRCLNLNDSLWLDELHTGWVVNDTWSQVAPRAQIGNQSPLWFYAVKVVTSLLGESEFSLRLLSLLAGTALMPTVYFLARRLTDAKSELAALLAAALVAVDHQCLFYSTEARPYACVQLLAAWQLWMFLTTVDHPTNRSRIALVLSTAVLFHLHYTAILVVIGEAIYLLGRYLFSRDRVPYRPYRISFDTLIGIPLLLPALPHLREISARRHQWDGMIGRPEWSDLLYVFPLWSTLLIPLIAAVIALLIMRWKGDRRPISSNYLAPVLLWFIAPLLFAWIVTRFDFAYVFFGRYLMTLAIGPILLAAILTSVLSNRLLIATCTVVVLSCATYESKVVEWIRYDGRALGDRAEDWRGAIRFLNERIDDESPILVLSGLIEESDPFLMPSPENVHYLTYPVNSLYHLRASGDQIFPAFFPELLESRAMHPESCWMIRRAKPGTIDSLRHYAISESRNFGAVNVFHLKLSAGPTAPSPDTNPNPPDRRSP